MSVSLSSPNTATTLGRCSTSTLHLVFSAATSGGIVTSAGRYKTAGAPFSFGSTKVWQSVIERESVSQLLWIYSKIELASGFDGGIVSWASAVALKRTETAKIISRRLRLDFPSNVGMEFIGGTSILGGMTDL